MGEWVRKFLGKVSKKVSKLYANHLHPKIPEINCKRNLLGEIFPKLSKHTVSRGFQNATCYFEGHFMIFTYTKVEWDREGLGKSASLAAIFGKEILLANVLYLLVERFPIFI